MKELKLLDKQQLRKSIVTKCKELSIFYRDDCAKSVLLHASMLLDCSNKIGVYRAYGWELDLRLVIQECEKLKKNMYQPYVLSQNKNMLFAGYEKNNIDIFSGNKNQDPLQKYVNWYDLDLIFLPLVAVDKLGNRLGKGGGYYDTTLANINEYSKPPILCGVGYSCQLVDLIVCDKWDIRLNYFVSELGLIKF